MKAAVVKNVGELVVCDVPMPEPGPYEALCEVLYGAVCTGTDSHLLGGHPPFCNWVKYPFILGHESIGRVVETGSKATHLQKGDVVTRVGCPDLGNVHSGWGGFAEFAIVQDWQAMKADGLPEADWTTHRKCRVLPVDVSPQDATMFITWRETYSYGTHMGIAPGNTVAVIGSGGNGLAFAAHARNLDAKWVTLIGAAKREPQARKLRCDAFVDYRSDDPVAAALAEQPNGFDYVIDVIGTAATSEMAIRLVADGGTFGIYGMDDVTSVSISPAKARGGFTFYPNRYDEAGAHDAILALYQAGKLDASIWLDQPAIELDDIADAFAAIAARTVVKPLIRIRG